jgi:hypothetical protein
MKNKNKYLYIGLISLFMFGFLIFSTNISSRVNNTASLWSAIVSFFSSSDISDCSENDIDLACSPDAISGCFCEGGVLDNNLGKIWKKDVIPANWDNGVFYCSNFGSEWSLPSVDDLLSVYDEYGNSTLSFIDGGGYWSNEDYNEIDSVFVFTKSAFPVIYSKDSEFLVSCVKVKNSSSSEQSISTCQDLQNINNNLSGNYILANNIDCSNTINWNNGEGFIPIGVNNESPFVGRFNGNGKIISGLYINRGSDSLFNGLFGSLKGAFVYDVGLTNINVTGGNYVGGLIGYTYEGTTINNSYVKGNVNGVNVVGGFMGWNNGDSNINNSYFNGKVVSSGDQSGGFVGCNGATITDSYSVAVVDGNSSSYGFTGCNYSLNNINSYWDKDVFGYIPDYSNFGAIAKTTSEMKTPSTFSDWDTNIWNLVDGAYPTLKTETVPPTNSCPFNNVLNAYNECESCDQNTDYLMTSCGDKPTLNPCNTCSSPERHLSVGAGCWYCVRTCGSLDGTAGMVLNTSTNECVCPPGTVFDGYGTCIDTPVVNVSVSLEASPTTVWEGKTTNISWTPTNAKTCTAFDGYSTWPGSLNATDGEHIWTTGALPVNKTIVLGTEVSAKTEYIYGVTCSNDTKTIIATTTVTVIPDLYPSGYAGNTPGRMSTALNTAGVTLGSNERAYLLYRDSYYYYTNQSQIAHIASCPTGQGYRVCVEDYNDGTYNHVLIGVK